MFGDGTVINAAGMLTGPINNNISNCKFQDIDKQGIWIHIGKTIYNYRNSRQLAKLWKLDNT